MTTEYKKVLTFTNAVIGDTVDIEGGDFDGFPKRVLSHLMKNTEGKLKRLSSPVWAVAAATEYLNDILGVE
jgi:hypothetical protein